MSAADRHIRARLAQDRDWATPTQAQLPLWPCFEAAVVKLLAQWDVRGSLDNSRHNMWALTDCELFAVRR